MFVKYYLLNGLDFVLQHGISWGSFTAGVKVKLVAGESLIQGQLHGQGGGGIHMHPKVVE